MIVVLVVCCGSEVGLGGAAVARAAMSVGLGCTCRVYSRGALDQSRHIYIPTLTTKHPKTSIHPRIKRALGIVTSRWPVVLLRCARDAETRTSAGSCFFRGVIVYVYEFVCVFVYVHGWTVLGGGLGRSLRTAQPPHTSPPPLTLSRSTLALITRLTHVGCTSTSTRDESRCRGSATSSTTHPRGAVPPLPLLMLPCGSSSVSRRENVHFPSFFCLTVASVVVSLIFAVVLVASLSRRSSLARTYMCVDQNIDGLSTHTQTHQPISQTTPNTPQTHTSATFRRCSSPASRSGTAPAPAPHCRSAFARFCAAASRYILVLPRVVMGVGGTRGRPSSVHRSVNIGGLATMVVPRGWVVTRQLLLLLVFLCPIPAGLPTLLLAHLLLLLGGGRLLRLGRQDTKARLCLLT